MSKDIMFYNIELEKCKFYHHKNRILFEKKV